ncbi:MAG: glycosyltransferase family 4 protein [Acidimicrobiales bacterium]
MPRRLRILTWHVHGAYLWYLSHIPHDLIVPVKPGRPEGYGGRSGTLRWPDNLYEVPAAQVADLELDAVLFQSHRNWLVDQHEILSPSQRRLPRLHLEHDPPRGSPTDTVHPVDDPEVLVVHVTPFNRLMWDCGPCPTAVVEHGVTVPAGVRWHGSRDRGVVVVNDLDRRGRRLGADVFERLATQVPLDLVGMGSERLGGRGEVPHGELPALLASYRFLFNPIRWTSLGLSVCEAMLVGLPVVALATTEMSTVIRSGHNGYAETDEGALAARMRHLIERPDAAARLGANARRTARTRFGLGRFVADWDAVLTAHVGLRRIGRSELAETVPPGGADTPGLAGGPLG